MFMLNLTGSFLSVSNLHLKISQIYNTVYTLDEHSYKYHHLTIWYDILKNFFERVIKQQYLNDYINLITKISTAAVYFVTSRDVLAVKRARTSFYDENCVSVAIRPPPW